MEERQRREKEIIRASLTFGSAVMLTKFYFIDIQSLCEIIEKEEARFQPCEIALVEYSLHSGISKSFHRFIDPGEEEGGGGERERGREGGREEGQKRREE